MFSYEIKPEIEPIMTWYFVGKKINVLDYDLNVLKRCKFGLSGARMKKNAQFYQSTFSKRMKQRWD